MCIRIGLQCSDASEPPYSIKDKVLGWTNEVRDLGVVFDNNLSFKSHILGIVSKCRKLCGFIRRTFAAHDPKLLFKFFCVFVRPILEYASPVWSPSAVKLIKSLESVQKRYTKMLPGFRDLPYAERLRLLDAESLEVRRIRLDLTLLSSVIAGKTLVNVAGINDIYFSGSSHHNLKARNHTKNIGANFWLDRSIRFANKLPSDILANFVNGKGIPSAKCFSLSFLRRVSNQ